MRATDITVLPSNDDAYFATLERAERAETALRELIFAGQGVLDWYEKEQWAGPHDWLAAVLARSRAALAGTPAPAETPDIEQIADGVRYGFGAITDFWRGFNDGIDALVAALTGIPAPAHQRDCASLRYVIWSSGYPDPPEPCDCGADPRSPGTPAPALDLDADGKEICNLSYLCPHHTGTPDTDQ